MFRTVTTRSLALVLITASASAFSTGSAAADGTAATQVAAADVPQYVVQDGQVDKATFNGYRRFHGTCHACHGQDAMGGSFAPSLVDSLQSLSYDEFKAVVLQGRQAQSAAGGVSAMPAFANDKNITKHLDDIYRYLAARSDGELGTGRPPKLPKKK
ncbi:MAG: cytochrome c [Granulosicoccus sp.]